MDFKVSQTLSEQLNLTAHETAPEELRQFFKLLKSKQGDLTGAITDIEHLVLSNPSEVSTAQRHKAFNALPKVPGSLSGHEEKYDAIRSLLPSEYEGPMVRDLYQVKIYAPEQIPGLLIIPGLLPDYIQVRLLDHLLHKELPNPQHQTNLHAHHSVRSTDGTSYFNFKPEDILFDSKDPTLHNPLNVKQVLEKKLRWNTLGGQYDWTRKLYPSEPPPDFPKDIAKFINTLFPDIEAQAAIVNLYSPGDTLSMHRDVSEEVNRGLVSISLGCECIFVLGNEDEGSHDIKKLAVRLKSGDALYMTGKSRLAWHGVPRILPDTCPEYLSEWPGPGYPEEWKYWMHNKRINLNVRQMREVDLG